MNFIIDWNDWNDWFKIDLLFVVNVKFTCKIIKQKPTTSERVDFCFVEKVVL